MKEKLQSLKKVGFTILAFLGFANFASAQCGAGEVAVSFDVTTDSWGYESYWEIVPTGNTCGTGTVASFGNTNVGCSGAGAQVAAASDPGAFGNNTTVTVGPVCLTIGTTYDIIMVDDWADGGTDVVSNQQSVNVSATSGNDVFTFTAVAPPSTPDAKMTASPVEYTIYPLSQVGNIVNTGNIENIGAGTATNAMVTVNVYELTGMSQVYTETSAPDSIQQGANLDFTFTGYTPSMVNNYYVEYIASINETDANMNNDTTGYIVQVDDSTYARDDANINGVTGALGIGAGASANGKLGQLFELTSADTLTSVDVFLRNSNASLNGQPLVVEVYDVAGGFPNTLLKSSTPITIDTTQNNLWNVEIPNGLIMAPGIYAVVVNEPDSNITLGTTTGVFTTGAGVVSWASNPAPISGTWSNSETFSFNVAYVLRPNFGPAPLSVGIEENASANFEVMPNPAVNNIMVKNIENGSTIEIVNNLGQVVYREVSRSTNANISVSDFDNGIYTIKVLGNDNVSTKSFVKQ